MEANFLPVWKTMDTPLVSLDESHVELFSVLVLFGLSLVAMLVRRHRQTVRHLVQLVALLVFFYVVYSCLGVFGMIRNTLHGVGLIGAVFTESFFWMSLPLVVFAFTIISGPYFCGWICPTGFFQELAAILREQVFRLIRRLPFGPSLLKPGPVKLVLVAVFFVGFMATVFALGNTKRFYVEDSSLYWAGALILLTFMVMAGWAKDRAIRALRGLSLAIIMGSAFLKSAIISPMHFAFADVRDPASALTTLVLVVASLFVSRAWCRYACPWGYLMGKLHGLSRLRVEADSNCTACGACNRICRVDAIVKGQVRLAECQFCLACVDVCPENSLSVVDLWRRQTQEAAARKLSPRSKIDGVETSGEG